jgi:hypothetical protein
LVYLQRGSNTLIDTTKPFSWTFNLLRTAGSANAKLRIGWGKAAADALGDWTVNGFGWSIVNGLISGWYYNGALTETSTTQSLSGSNVQHELSIVRTLTAFEFYINGTLHLTLTVAGFSLTSNRWFRMECDNLGDTSNNAYRMSQPVWIDLQ